MMRATVGVLGFFFVGLWHRFGVDWRRESSFFFVFFFTKSAIFGSDRQT